MKITAHSTIEFYKLRSSPEPDKNNLYTLLRTDTEERIKVEKHVLDLVELLEDGKTVQEAAHEIKFSFHVVLVMLKILEDAHFFKSIDGIAVDNSEKKSRVILTKHSTIEFYNLRSNTQPDEHNLYALVRWDTDDTLKVDKNVIELVNQLKNGKTVQEAANTINFSVDVVLLLLKMLDEAHFFKSVDGEEIEDTGEKIKPWLTNVDRKWFRWLTSKPLIATIATVIGLGIVFGIVQTGIPSYKSFFWIDDIFVVCLSLFVVEIVNMLLHESAHFFITKAVGGEAVMRISYRYIYIVAETESYHLGLVPKKKRYLIYFAGAFMDAITIGLCYWFLVITKMMGIETGLLANFLLAVVILEVIAIIWQCNAFLETDIYNFLSEFLGIENLRNDAIKYIAQHTKKWSKVLFFPIQRLLQYFSSDDTGPSDDLRLFNKSEKKKMFIYVLVLITGILFTTVEFIFYTIPKDYTYIVDSVQSIQKEMQRANIIGVIKSAVVIGLVLFEYVLLILLKGKEIARRKQRN